MLNPSPYMFYFNFAPLDLQVIGASPEMHVRLEGGTAGVRPIAGTRRRGPPRPKTRRWPPSCWPTPRSEPNT